MRGRVGKGKGGPVSSAAGPLTLPGLGAAGGGAAPICPGEQR